MSHSCTKCQWIFLTFQRSQDLKISILSRMKSCSFPLANAAGQRIGIGIVRGKAFNAKQSEGKPKKTGRHLQLDSASHNCRTSRRKPPATAARSASSGRRFLRADGSWHRLCASAPITADTPAQSRGPAGERRFQTNANRIKKRTLALRCCQRGCQRRAPALENRVFSPLIEASFPEGRSSPSAPPHLNVRSEKKN